MSFEHFGAIMLDQQRAGHGLHVDHAKKIFAYIGDHGAAPAGTGFVICVRKCEEPGAKIFALRGKATLPS
jgi:hypothetical protein